MVGKDPSRNLNKSGDVTINGTDRSKVNYSHYLGYVQQDDILLQSMSVKECLQFAAKMKLPPTVDKDERVEELITSLKLNKCADTKIGGPLVKGVSGGERKRTSIGVELITNPNLIFLDEPTTGLDSFTATNVIEVLSDLAASGRTVITTIHQPNSEIFELFDQLMLLANGRTLYHNSALKAVDHFKLWGYECPHLTNPADYFMNMMSIEAYQDIDESDEDQLRKSRSKVQEDYNQKIDFLADKYEESELKWDISEVHPEATRLESANEYRLAILFQFFLLFWRSFINIIRIPISSYVRGITYAVLAIVWVLVFGQMDDDCASIQNRSGVLFFVTLNLIMNAVQGVILTFPDERAVFIREQASGTYSATAYFFAKVLSDIPSFIVFPLIFCLITFFGLQLNDESIDIFFIYLAIAVLLSVATTGWGMLIGAAIPDKQVAVALTPVFVIPFMLFSGFFVNQDNIPVFLKPLEYVSLFKYGYQAFVQNEFDGLKINCQGRDPLAEYDFQENREESILGIVGLGLGFYFLAYIVILLAARSAKK